LFQFSRRAAGTAADLRNVAFAHSEKAADGYNKRMRVASLTYRDYLGLTDVLLRVVVDVDADQFRLSSLLLATDVNSDPEAVKIYRANSRIRLNHPRSHLVSILLLIDAAN